MDFVVVAATINGVVAIATIDKVLAAATSDEVIDGATINFVAAAVTIDFVRYGRGTAVDDVGRAGSFYQIGITWYFDSIESAPIDGNAAEREDSHKGRQSNHIYVHIFPH